MRGPRAADATPSSAGSPREARSSAPVGRATDGPLSEQPTQVGPKRVPSPPKSALGCEAFEKYQTALARLGSRDQRAIRGRIEERLAYAALAKSLGVDSAAAARGVVTRALGRLVEGNGRITPDPARLDGLVASVADGWPQDWGAICASAMDERTRRAVSSLRTIAAIADSRGGAASPGLASGRDEPPPPGPAEEAPRHGRRAMQRDAVPALGQWGRFVLLSKLGEGAYGEVYLAHDTQLDREVALKLLKLGRSSADPGQRLLREARMLARVRHPNVASVYGAGEHDGRAGMWMELVRGVNLEELVRSRGPMSGCEAALVGIDICRALAAVHAAGLVHRDVKASNVMREEGGRIVLADFGAGSGPNLRQRQQFAGTPLYLAPEVLAGAEATVRSDLYSLGVVLFRMVTATYPRRVAHVEELLDPRACGATASLRDLRPDLPDAFVAAVEVALAAQPADRPPSAGAFRSMLGLVLGVPNSWRRACRAPRPALSATPTIVLGSPGSRSSAPTADPSRPR
jgi:hypothetical protein